MSIFVRSVKDATSPPTVCLPAQTFALRPTVVVVSTAVNQTSRCKLTCLKFPRDKNAKKVCLLPRTRPEAHDKRIGVNYLGFCYLSLSSSLFLSPSLFLGGSSLEEGCAPEICPNPTGNRLFKLFQPPSQGPLRLPRVCALLVDDVHIQSVTWSLRREKHAKGV